MYTNNIKLFRKQKNLTIIQLSNLSGITPGYLCHLENGTRCNPSYSVMKRICTSLNKEIYDVFN